MLPQVAIVRGMFVRKCTMRALGVLACAAAFHLPRAPREHSIRLASPQTLFERGCEHL